MLRVLSRPLLPLALLVSVYLFLRGHNAPGGGFIAGLVTGTAIVLQYVAYGSALGARAPAVESTRRRSRAGLLLATPTGLASWAFGAPFLTSTFGYVHWPVVGEFELASAMVFDLGVYLAVVGVVMVIIGRLGGAVGPRPHCAPGGALSMEALVAIAIGVLTACGRVPAAARAHLPRAARADAAVLCGEPVPVRLGPAGRGERAAHRPGARPLSRIRCRRRWCSPPS